jgi:transposase
LDINFGGFYMSKHSVAFKHSVVDFLGGGERSDREVGAQLGIDHSTERKWVASHAEHGLAGLARKFSQYDAALKRSVLQRMWNDGLSRRQAAAIFNIRSVGCLSDWERRNERDGIEGLVSRRRGRPRSMPEPPVISKQTDATRNDASKSREELVAARMHGFGGHS